MNPNSEKIKTMVSQRRIKLHLFEPSQRKIWTIVGVGSEHWMSPEDEYCSCPGYYFGMLNGKGMCYHLESFTLARTQNKFETIVFSDEEYENFLSGLVSDLLIASH